MFIDMKIYIRLSSFLMSSILMITSLASLAETSEKSCQVLFSSSAPLIPLTKIQAQIVLTSKFSTNEKENFLKLRIDAIYKPQDKIGYLFSIKRLNPETPVSYLWKSVLDAPEYFARYDMYADQVQLIIPDAVRLNSKNLGRIQFKNISPSKSQLYSNEDFENHLFNYTLLLASSQTYFEHDRLHEHLTGALATSNKAIKKIINYIQFRRAFKNTVDATDPQSFVGNKLRYFSDTAAQWDNLSNSMGRAVMQIAATKGAITAGQISVLRDVVTKTDMDFSVETEMQLDYASTEVMKQRRRPLTSQMAFDIATSDFSEEKKSNLISEIRTLEQRFLKPPLSENEIMDETFRIINEITNCPISELREIWQKSPKEFGRFI